MTREKRLVHPRSQIPSMWLKYVHIWWAVTRKFELILDIEMKDINTNFCLYSSDCCTDRPTDRGITTHNFVVIILRVISTKTQDIWDL